MPTNRKKLKINVHVDESGQDPTSPNFVVVAVLSTAGQTDLREKLEAIEQHAGTGRKKWHKLRQKNRMNFLSQVLDEESGELVYFGKYRKPVSFLAAMSNVISEAIRHRAAGRPHRATVYVDGIDKQKAQEITNVLRGGGITLGLVRSRRDESDSLIRLADMWAGCIRAAHIGNDEANRLVIKALKIGYMTETTKT